nr:MAG TPA: tail assembly protein [Caudoviricetes sp.]
MAGFLNFIRAAVSLVLSSSNGNSGAYFVLSCGGRIVNFPVSPASFDVADSYGNSSININALGEMNMLGKRKLTTLTFASFFPAQYYGFEQSYPLGDPYSYVDSIKTMAQMAQPARIAISGTTISMPVTIDSFQYGEHDGTGDVYFSISLREYRDFTTSILSTDSITGLKSRAAETLDSSTIMARPGQTVMDIAAACCRGRSKISTQSNNRLKLYNALVKMGGVSAGTSLTATNKSVTVDGKSVELEG